QVLDRRRVLDAAEIDAHRVVEEPEHFLLQSLVAQRLPGEVPEVDGPVPDVCAGPGVCLRLCRRTPYHFCVPGGQRAVPEATAFPVNRRLSPLSQGLVPSMSSLAAATN